MAASVQFYEQGLAAIEVPGGVLAIELSGYGDPSTADLASLSTSGASAVVRCNIQAHDRFGCARAGELVFDDDEFTYVGVSGRRDGLPVLVEDFWRRTR